MSPIFKKRANGPERNREGFSLIEVVVYVSLLVILMIATTTALLAVSRTARELAAWHSLQSEGVSIMDRLGREVRVAGSVSGGTFDASPGRLVLTTGGLSGGNLANMTIGVDANDNLFIKVDGSATTTLTSRTEVRSLIWRSITSGDVRAVRLELLLGTKPGLVDKTISLSNTIILRSSYAQ